MQSFCLHNIPQGLFYDILYHIQNRVHPLSALYRSPQSNYSLPGCRHSYPRIIIILETSKTRQKPHMSVNGFWWLLSHERWCSYCANKSPAQRPARIVSCTIAGAFYHGRGGGLCSEANKRGDSYGINKRWRGTVGRGWTCDTGAWIDDGCLGFRKWDRHELRWHGSPQYSVAYLFLLFCFLPWQK